jgi:hypothetical protein
MTWKLVLVISTLLLSYGLAGHTAKFIFDIAKFAAEKELDQFTLVESTVHLFKRQGDHFIFRFDAEVGIRYKVLVLTDGEVLENVDVNIVEGGRLVFAEQEPATFNLAHSWQSKGGRVLVRLVAQLMPEGEGYGAVVLLGPK